MLLTTMLQKVLQEHMSKFFSSAEGVLPLLSGHTANLDPPCQRYRITKTCFCCGKVLFKNVFARNLDPCGFGLQHWVSVVQSRNVSKKCLELVQAARTLTNPRCSLVGVSTLACGQNGYVASSQGLNATWQGVRCVPGVRIPGGSEATNSDKSSNC